MGTKYTLTNPSNRKYLTEVARNYRNVEIDGKMSYIELGVSLYWRVVRSVLWIGFILYYSVLEQFLLVAWIALKY